MSLSTAMPQTPQPCLVVENNPVCRPVLWICLQIPLCLAYISMLHIEEQMREAIHIQIIFLRSLT